MRLKSKMVARIFAFMFPSLVGETAQNLIGVTRAKLF
jgi:hypothetical protein